LLHCTIESLIIFKVCVDELIKRYILTPSKAKTLTKTREDRKMNYIINEIKGYMKHMSFEAAVAKVRRAHLGGKEYLITQAATKVFDELCA